MPFETTKRRDSEPMTRAKSGAFMRAPALGATRRLAAGLLAASVTGASVVAHAEPDWTFTYGVNIGQTYTDNVDLDPDATAEDAFITSVAPTFTLRSEGPRLTNAWNLSVSIENQIGGVDEGVNVFPRLSGFGTAELWKNRVFLDTRSSVSQVLLDSEDNDAQSNRELVQTYSISPSLRQRLGGLADATLSYTYSAVMVENSGQAADDANDISDTASHAIGLQVEGRRSPRMSWSVAGSASTSDSNNDAETVERRSVSLNTEYFVIRPLSFLASVGYQQFDDGNANNDISGATWEAGVHWTPGTRTDARLTYGRRDDQDSFRGNLSYKLGGRTTIRMSYTEVLETGEEQINNALVFIVTDPDTGELIDSRTGLPFSGDPNEISIDSNTSRNRIFTGTIVGSTGRNRYNASLSYQDREEDGDLTETIVTLGSSLSRSLSPRANATINAQYSNSDLQDQNRLTDTYTISARYNYNVFRNIGAVSSYSFRLQDSTDADQEFTENRAFVGVNISF